MTLIIALVFLVACSAFFSASETAFSSLNQIRLKSRAEDGDASAARVLAMAEKYDKLLSTILIGNNIVNIAAASIGTILFTRALGAERGATMSTIVLTIVVLIFGEVTPKSLAKEMPETVATAVSPMLNLLMVLFTPLTWLFSQWKRLLGHFVHSTEEDTITEGELMTMVSEAENDGELTDRESELIPVCGSSVSVICKCVYDYRNTCRSITFVCDTFVVITVCIACRLFNCSVYIIVRHII